MKNVYEQFFYMKYSGGWSFAEAYNLPIGLRNWFFERLVKQLEDEKAAIDGKGSGGGSNRQTLSAHNQPKAPSNLRR